MTVADTFDGLFGLSEIDDVIDADSERLVPWFDLVPGARIRLIEGIEGYQEFEYLCRDGDGSIRVQVVEQPGLEFVIPWERLQSDLLHEIAPSDHSSAEAWGVAAPAAPAVDARPIYLASLTETQRALFEVKVAVIRFLQDPSREHHIFFENLGQEDLDCCGTSDDTGLLGVRQDVISAHLSTMSRSYRKATNWHPPTANTVRGWWSDFTRDGKRDLAALLPASRRDSDDLRGQPEWVRRVFEDRYRDILDRSDISTTALLDFIEDDLDNEQHLHDTPRPSRHKCAAIVKKLDRNRSVNRASAAARANAEAKPEPGYLGSSFDIPRAMVELDQTPVDIMNRDGNALGRFYLVVATCVATSTILALRCLHRPANAAAAVSLVVWDLLTGRSLVGGSPTLLGPPVEKIIHLPSPTFDDDDRTYPALAIDGFTIDQGREYSNTTIQRIAATHRLNIIECAGGQPTQKPHVEAKIGALSIMQQYVEGYTGGRLERRAKSRCLTMHALNVTHLDVEQYLRVAANVLNHSPSKPDYETGSGMTSPATLYAQGVQRRGARVYNPVLLYPLLPSEVRILTDKGAELNQDFYDVPPHLSPLVAELRGESVALHHDTRLPGVAYLALPERNAWIRLFGRKRPQYWDSFGAEMLRAAHHEARRRRDDERVSDTAQRRNGRRKALQAARVLRERSAENLEMQRAFAEHAVDEAFVVDDSITPRCELSGQAPEPDAASPGPRPDLSHISAAGWS